MGLSSVARLSRDATAAADFDAQREAHQDLASYLYVVAYNYLRLRQADLYHLADFAA